jgi:ribosomal protein S27E
MKKINFSFKKDKYKSARGGHSRLLNVCCRKCENVVVVYQKDGPGNLRRLYLDRIFAPDDMAGLQDLNIKDVPALKCKKCSELLGTPYIYPKEKRKAFRLYQDSVIRRLRKLEEKQNHLH